MATTDISTEIVSITGVAAHAASDEFIVSAQKFIASSIPKDLLWFASAQSSAIQNSSGFDVYSSDSVLAVEREGYPASEVPFSMSKWIDDSASLHKATNLYPKWYHAQGKVFIKPDPSSGGSNDGYVYYVEHTQLDDDSDLRNAVIFHASAQEFAKLATGSVPSWTSPPVPVAPSLGAAPTISDLSVSAVLPSAPSISTVTFTSLDSNVDASAPTFNAATVSAGNIYGGNTAPTYTKPTVTSQEPFNDFFESGSLNPFDDSDPGALTLTSVSPSVPSLTSVTFTSIDTSLDVVRPIISTATVAASSVYTGSAPAYTKPTVVLGSAPTVSDLSISAVPPSVPGVSAQVIADPSSFAPAYTKPSLNLGATPTISNLTITSIAPIVGVEKLGDIGGTGATEEIDKSDIVGVAPNTDAGLV